MILIPLAAVIARAGISKGAARLGAALFQIDIKDGCLYRGIRVLLRILLANVADNRLYPITALS